MRYSLATLTRRANPGMRRRAIVLRDIVAPATLATDLFRAAYAPIIQAWTRHAETIIAEYERSLSQLTTDSPSDLQARLAAAETEMERLYILLDAAVQDWAVRTEKWQRGKFRGAVLSATGVDLNTLIGPEDVRGTLDQIIAWNTSLIRDVSDQARQRIGNAVFSGLTERRPAREVAKEIREAVAMSRRRATGIASDQLSKLTSSLAAERRREAGLSIYKYRHSGKKHPREDHRARDGKLYGETPADAGQSVDGQTVNAPIAAGQRAGQLPWCGCREQGVVVFD
ncbi:phage minor head protein [Sphingomonas soli]|uniref:phage minor head protein n=1 Tax=Sphingomonas soli TaxID=266127 RepID=UPI00083689F8|nr:phage minor head protein [Sphingomonas soli]